MTESMPDDVEHVEGKKNARGESRVQEDTCRCAVCVIHINPPPPIHTRKFVRFASLRTAIVAYAFCIQWPHQCRLNPLHRGENRSVFLRGRGRRPGHVCTVCIRVTARRLSHTIPSISRTRHVRRVSVQVFGNN